MPTPHGRKTYAEHLESQPTEYRSEELRTKDRREIVRRLARRAISDAVDVHYPHLAVAMSWGKDSVTMLSLLREMYPDLPMKLLFTDTGRKFPETYEYRGVVEAHFTPVETLVYAPESPLETCDECKAWKVQAAVDAPLKYKLEALLVGTRADEHEARDDGSYIRVVEGVRRVHPILDWTEEDIWAYLRDRGVPTHPLYEEGYRSLGCAAPCTVMTPVGYGERGGRAPDKEDQMAMLRGEGYW